MHHHIRAALAAAVTLAALAGCSPTAFSVSGNSTVPNLTQNQNANRTTLQRWHTTFHEVCPRAQLQPYHFRCLALASDDALQPRPDQAPRGYGPSELQAAYNFNPGAAPGLVAIVDAYNNPNLIADQTVYRTQFTLPLIHITQINQNGGKKLPANSMSWGAEESLDVDMVAANCPNCDIVVVEANDSSFKNLKKAEQTAFAQNPLAVSNSFGGAEFKGEDNGRPFNGNRAVTASSGDDGYGAEYPAASADVIAVGGTSLDPDPSNPSNPRGWDEIVWPGTGSGCSAFVAQPAWQAVLPLACKKRMIGDIAYDADPSTGVAVYDTFLPPSVAGWGVFGGTSVGAPAIAAMIVAGGNAVAFTDAARLYAGKANFYNDVITGSNGKCTPPKRQAYWCNAVNGNGAVIAGYDGPTGLGTPETLGNLK
jgi:subtilase family serine protease